MIGMAHDNDSALIGENIGLISLLKKDNIKFFDLKDPCHGLNLVIEHSLSNLPPEMMQFVHSIASHFASPQPQRKTRLRKIQEENGKSSLSKKAGLDSLAKSWRLFR